MSEIIRLFIAIEIPTSIRNELGILIEKLKKASDDGHIRWARPDSIHLTLKFIGDLSTGSVANVTKILETVALKRSRFDLSVGELGCFPDFINPRVIWIGISEDSSELANLQNEIELVLKPIGIISETRPYHAHLTLGRVRKPRDVGEIFSMVEIGTIGHFQVDEFCLIKSDLRPDGAVHTNLASFRLQK